MNQRDEQILKSRPEIPGAGTSGQISEDELFQNQTLRPVIKLQNDLLIESFKNYIQKHKSVFLGLSVEKRMVYIEHAIQKDMKFRNSLKGMILGQFTIAEYHKYIRNSSALNKRMMNLVKERIQSSIQLLDDPISIR